MIATPSRGACPAPAVRSRIGHIENGRNSVRKPELTVLLDLYGAGDEEHEVLEELRKEASKREWWSVYRLPSWLQLYVGLETDATTMRSFESELIPGLLRMHRQSRVTDAEAPLLFSTVVSEAAFRRALGDAEVGPAQLAHVIELAQRPNVTLHVLPYAAGLHPSMSGSFTVLTFDAGVSPPLGYQEYAVGGHVVDDPDSVQRLADLWELLRSQSPHLGRERGLAVGAVT